MSATAPVMYPGMIPGHTDGMILRVESSGRTVLPLLIFMIVFLQPITDDTSLQLRLSEDEDDLSSEKATRIADDTSLQLRLSEDEDDLSSEKATRRLSRIGTQ